MFDYKMLPGNRELKQKFYKSNLWRRKREEIILNEPLCRICKSKGILTLAEVVDHIEDIDDSPHKCLNTDNLQPLCVVCHNKKTANKNKDNGGLVNGAIDWSILE